MRMISVVFAVAAALLVAGGCGGSKSTGLLDKKDAGTGGTGGAGGAGGTSGCKSSLDCGKSQVCDKASGQCVDCLTDNDCKSGNKCVGNVCRSPCKSDKDCTSQGLLCDTAKGACVECIQSTDCSGTEYCASGVCKAQLCEPGKASCQGNGIATCNADGSALGAPVACGGKKTCVQLAGGPICEEPDAGAGGSAGTGGTGGVGGVGGTGTGGSGGVDSGGSDAGTVCTPNQLFCDAQLAKRCSSNGTTSSTVDNCSTGGRTCANGVCETGLAAYWPFDEGSGSSAMDATGNGNDGSLVGAQWGNGKFGASVRFDSSGQYVDVGDRLNSVAVPFSVTAWVYLNSAGSRLLVASDANATSWNGFWVQIDASTWQVTYGDGTGTTGSSRRSMVSATAVPTHAWVHLAAIVSGPTAMNLYVNGTAVLGTASGTGGPMVHTNDPFRIATRDVGGPSFDGRIDDLRIYDRSLSASEVKALANQP